jgi:hypothetical protein
MICPACGSENDGECIYCEYCGEKLQTKAETSGMKASGVSMANAGNSCPGSRETEDRAQAAGTEEKHDRIGPESSRSRKAVLPVWIIAAAVIVVLLLVFLIRNGNFGMKNSGTGDETSGTEAVTGGDGGSEAVSGRMNGADGSTSESSGGIVIEMPENEENNTVTHTGAADSK